MAAAEFVKMTNSTAAIDDKFVNMMTFLFHYFFVVSSRINGKLQDEIEYRALPL